MDARLLAFLILLPFVVAFVYAGIHEYLRFKTHGRSDYGLAFDEETGTTHVKALSDKDNVYDPEDFDPNDYNDPELQDNSDDPKS